MERTIEITIKPARLIPDSFIVFVTYLCAEGRYIEAYALARIEWPTLFENAVEYLRDSLCEVMAAFQPAFQALIESCAAFNESIKGLNLNAG